MAALTYMVPLTFSQLNCYISAIYSSIAHTFLSQDKHLLLEPAVYTVIDSRSFI